MEFCYSKIIDPCSYQTYGLVEDIPLRQHNDPDNKEIKGALRAQNDWGQLVNPIRGYKGGLGDRFSFIRVTVPECLPERIEIVSYANEFAFLYDDAMEQIDLQRRLEAAGTDPFLETFGSRDLLDLTPEPTARPEKRLQARILAEMKEVDPVRAVTTMKAWGRFVQLASETRARPFDTMEEYVPSRVIDAGELIWFGTLTFGMALTIPEQDIPACMELARSGYAALGLTNDLYSWDKEREAARSLGQSYVFNAIWVIMKEHGVGEEEAKRMCSGEIQKYVRQYRQDVREAGAHMRLAKDTKTYLEAVMYSISGNLVWSIDCPRYRNI
ncbi:Fusicoccadiene synthase [Apiospora phragmitis]|uniref:Fusicoccadiene synthase n=1 Tax=Apiospora phragmitis TaxID=2905665 RepID=A0ABR1USH8_9PEZI